MFRHAALILTLGFASVPPLLFPDAAAANTALTRATLESVRNQVRLIRQNKSARAARRSDTMTPGDSLATAASSMADLRFNDRSLARLGERAVFRFSRGTRSVDLTRGTLVLLVPPGRGGTSVRTPNAAAGIRGSGLITRVNPDTQTTTFIALTTSQIETCNQDVSECVVLEAGQMAVFVEDRLEGVYNVDLAELLATGPILEDLDLTEIDTSPDADEALNVVRQEIIDGLVANRPIPDENAIVNPDFVSLSDSPSGDSPNLNASVVNFEVNDLNDFERSLRIAKQPLPTFSNTTDLRNALVGGEILANPNSPTITPVGVATGGTPGVTGTTGITGVTGVTGVVDVGSGNTGNDLPGVGNTGGNFPGGGNTGGVFPGGGNTGGNFPGGGNNTPPNPPNDLPQP